MRNINATFAAKLATAGNFLAERDSQSGRDYLTEVLLEIDKANLSVDAGSIALSQALSACIARANLAYLKDPLVQRVKDKVEVNTKAAQVLEASSPPPGSPFTVATTPRRLRFEAQPRPRGDLFDDYVKEVDGSAGGVG